MRLLSQVNLHMLINFAKLGHFILLLRSLRLIRNGTGCDGGQRGQDRRVLYFLDPGIIEWAWRKTKQRVEPLQEWKKKVRVLEGAMEFISMSLPRECGCCRKCGNRLSPPVAKVDGELYLLCEKCGSVTDTFYESGHRVVCPTCHTASNRCLSCGQEGSPQNPLFEYGPHLYHGDCATCSVCYGALQFRDAVYINNRLRHANCKD